MITQRFKQQGISLTIEFDEYHIIQTGNDTYNVPATLYYGFGYEKQISLSFTKDFDIFKTSVSFYFINVKYLFDTIKIFATTKRKINNILQYHD